MIYDNLKKFVKKFPIFWKLLTWSKDRLINLSRLKDVLMMMILFHVKPEQIYRFSTRRFLPCKKNRFSKESKPAIPYDLLESKSRNISMMKEINVIGRGSSFDLNNLKNLKGPIFLNPAWGPLRIDNNGKIFYRHLWSHETGKFVDNVEELFNDHTSKILKEDKNISYVVSEKKTIELFRKNGCNVLSAITFATDENGNHYPMDERQQTPSYLNLFDHDQCKLISIVEKILKPPLLPPHPQYMQTGSFFPALCALSFFAKKINVYGWDFFLESSPENMSYWQLFFNIYSYRLDKIRGKTQFEEALINFYYGYQFSKLPNVKIHGYMGKLAKHEKLIQRIEKVFFN